ncbi:MAG TPA: hypothetical protein VMC82_01940 [Thermoplasmata archaeon]|nr:hypothetical protein [Thermoplasmata archaeon]
MLSFADVRSFESSEERLAHCLFCGKELVLLPDDRRQGSCFDCLSLSLPSSMPCPECRTEIPGEERGVGCAACGWYPLGG